MKSYSFCPALLLSSASQCAPWRQLFSTFLATLELRFILINNLSLPRLLIFRHSPLTSCYGRWGFDTCSSSLHCLPPNFSYIFCLLVFNYYYKCSVTNYKFSGLKQHQFIISASWDQKSENGLKSRYWQDFLPSIGSVGEPFPCLLQLLKAAHFPWLMAPFLVTPTWSVSDSDPHPPNPFYKDACD